MLPGDRIVASVTFASGHYTLEVVDESSPFNDFTTTQTCATGLTCNNSTAEWIAESPGGSRGYYPLPPFSLWHVASGFATSGGVAKPISGFPNLEISMIDSSQTYFLAQPGTLASGSFSDKWLNSY